MNVIEVEKGCHTCQKCRTDASYRVDGRYLCKHHYDLLLKKLSEQGIVVTIG